MRLSHPKPLETRVLDEVAVNEAAGVATLQALIDALEARMDTAETDITAVEGDIVTINTALSTGGGRLDALETTSADHETRIVALES